MPGLSAYGARVKDAYEAEIMVKRKARCSRNRFVAGDNNFDSNHLTGAVEIYINGIVVVEGLCAINDLTRVIEVDWMGRQFFARYFDERLQLERILRYGDDQRSLAVSLQSA
jgi:hypothetical protein